MLPVLSDKNHCNTKESESLDPEVFSVSSTAARHTARPVGNVRYLYLMEGTESPILHGSRQLSHDPQGPRRQLIEDIGKTLTKLHYRGSYQNFDAWQADIERALSKLRL